jgi:methionyl-tRNA formyltransferase
MTELPIANASGRPRTVFFGSPALAVPSLERVVAATQLCAVVTQPDRPAGRGLELAEPPVKQAARRLAPATPILQPEKIRTGELEAALRALSPDLFVVVAYGRILPQALLDLPALGPWNVHASLLPRLRGAAPIQWAIMNGDAITGVSIMRMEAGLDTGPVAARAELPIRDDDTAATLGPRLAVLGADLLDATLPAIAAGTVRLEAQDEALATVAPILRKQDGHLDFSRPAAAVSARARGVDPWPGAAALLGGEPVRLFGARALPGAAAGAGGGAAAAPPGTVVAIDEGRMLVACGDGGAVAFSEVQVPGRRRQPAAAAAAGRTIGVGIRFA